MMLRTTNTRRNGKKPLMNFLFDCREGNAASKQKNCLILDENAPRSSSTINSNVWHSKNAHTLTQSSLSQHRNFTKNILCRSVSSFYAQAKSMCVCVCMPWEYASWNWAYKIVESCVSSINGNDNPSRFYFYSPTKSELKHFHKIFIRTLRWYGMLRGMYFNFYHLLSPMDLLLLSQHSTAQKLNYGCCY